MCLTRVRATWQRIENVPILLIVSSFGSAQNWTRPEYKRPPTVPLVVPWLAAAACVALGSTQCTQCRSQRLSLIVNGWRSNSLLEAVKRHPSLHQDAFWYIFSLVDFQKNSRKNSLDGIFYDRNSNFQTRLGFNHKVQNKRDGQIGFKQSLNLIWN